jgi:hypothetical protein
MKVVRLSGPRVGRRQWAALAHLFHAYPMPVRVGDMLAAAGLSSHQDDYQGFTASLLDRGLIEPIGWRRDKRPRVDDLIRITPAGCEARITQSGRRKADVTA